jgi:hypothetical protein
MSIEVLSEKYAWEDFLRSLSNYLVKAYKPLVAPYMKRYSLPAPPSPPRRTSQTDSYKQQNGHNHGFYGSGDLDINALAEQAAQEALQAYGQDHLRQYSQQNGGNLDQSFTLTLMLISSRSPSSEPSTRPKWHISSTKW